MTPAASPKRLLLVTGLSGAGKSTVLNTLEDLGWEVVDNLPLSLVTHLLATPPPHGSGERPLAIGLDSRTRGFDPARIVSQIEMLERDHRHPVETLFLDCDSAVLTRRFSETRRRHPLATDRPAADGIAAERDLLEPLRRAADQIIDTTDTDSNALRQAIRIRFAGEEDAPTLTVQSFGFARGLPRNADLVFDMRFLQNPHWRQDLRALTGLAPAVAEHIATDPAYEDAVGRIEDLLLTLLPRYRAEGKSYVTIAFGCTGGRHRSVHVADRTAKRLRAAGFSPTVEHRDLALPSRDDVEGGSERPAGGPVPAEHGPAAV